MASAKAWKLTPTQLEALIDAVESDGYCRIEVYAATSDKIADCDLYLKLATGWQDYVPIDPPVIPPVS